MNERLMSEQDLQHVTGKKRHSTQAEWFRMQFGVTPVQSADGRIILTWAAFEGMQAKRAGIVPANGETPRPQLLPARRAVA